MMRYALALGLSLLTVGCSKHKCELETDAQKSAFGELADMTAGAERCYVKGTSLIAGLAMADLSCEIGKKDCLPTLETSHYELSQEQVSTNYTTFLEQKGWDVEKENYEGERANGKPLEGIRLTAKKGDDGLLITMYNLAEKVVDVRVLKVEKKMIKDKDDK